MDHTLEWLEKKERNRTTNNRAQNTTQKPKY